MKTFRNLIVIALFLFVLTFVSACIVIPRHKFYDDIDKETIASIDFYDLRNANTYGSGFLETEIPVYTLPINELDEFLNDLANIRFSDYIIISLAATDPSFHYGDWVVRINYKDGFYTLISCDGYGETFNANNKAISGNHYGCNEEEWELFISRHIPAEIFK